MWAGSSIQWLAPMPLDAPIEVRSTIESVNLKTGRSGTLGFVSLRNRWYSGDVCGIDELQTAVYREAAGATAPASAAAAAAAPAPAATVPDGDWHRARRCSFAIARSASIPIASITTIPIPPG
jgi:3-methylfumaryl-CoA hydratase